MHNRVSAQTETAEIGGQGYYEAGLRPGHYGVASSLRFGSADSAIDELRMTRNDPKQRCWHGALSEVPTIWGLAIVSIMPCRSRLTF